VRKLIATAAIAALAAGAIASTAGAQTVSKFSVQTVTTSHHVVGGVDIDRGRLAEVGERSETVGFFKAKSRGNHLRAVFFFPDGKIKANGNFTHAKVPIVGGTRRWNGASGKLKFRPLGEEDAVLTFTVVQG
jgi:hypothetical protein